MFVVSLGIFLAFYTQYIGEIKYISQTLCDFEVSVVFFCLVCYEYDSFNSEIEGLTEDLFHQSEPNIFQHVKVNLQGQTSSWSRSDDAALP